MKNANTAKFFEQLEARIAPGGGHGSNGSHGSKGSHGSCK